MEELKRKAEVKAKVYEYIKKQRGVSYAELERYFEVIGYSYKGTAICCSIFTDKVIFWQGWHRQAFSVVDELIKDHKIHRRPAPPLLYLLDGKGLNLPKVEQFENYKRIKRESWLPCILTA